MQLFRLLSALRAVVASLALFAGATGVAALTDQLDEARAQNAVTGAIRGIVSEAADAAPLPGVIVQLTSPALFGSRSTVTDEQGEYLFTGLPPGQYAALFSFNGVSVERNGITVNASHVAPVYQSIDLGSGLSTSELIEIEDAPPAIDPTSSIQGLTIGSGAIRYLPTFSRTFEETLNTAAGAQVDRLGPAFSGSTSLENQYTVDGANTTTLRYGASGSSIIHDFIAETEVITGGYNAEYGRSTGAVVNVATKSGSNLVAGSVFGYLSAGALAGDPARTQTQGAAIDSQAKSLYDATFGVEVGGPVIPDRLFFFVGFAPRRGVLETTRITKRQLDCRGVDPATGGLGATCDARPLADGGLADGIPDRVPETGQLLYEDVDREVRRGQTSSYVAIGKLSFALGGEHQGQVSLLADRSAASAPGIVGLRGIGTDTTSLTLDGAARFTSRFHQGKTELEALIGWHRAATDITAIDAGGDALPNQTLLGTTLGSVAGFGGESARTAAACRDGGEDDLAPLIANCPMDSAGYVIGGPGLLTHAVEERWAGRLGALRRFDFFGDHELKAGVDLEQNRRSAPRLYSGGAQVFNVVGQLAHVQRFVRLAPAEGDLSPFDDECRTAGADGEILTVRCAHLDYREGAFGTAVDGETFNWSGYLRDSWRPLPNLTLNLGVRYEEQRLRYAEQVRGKIDPLSGVRFGKNAVVLRDQWAPRLGALYDWTAVGRSKVYAHWGRYYESIPLDINDRSFGGEVVYQQDFTPTECGPDDPNIGGPNGAGCLASDKVGDLGETIIGSSGTLVAPGLEGQYLDETLAGVEYEIWPDLVLGVALQHRTLGRVIEDVSPDGAVTYLVANPGSFSAREERALEERIAKSGDDAERARLQYELELYRGIRNFDRPVRDYTALTLTARHHLTRAFYLQASYTYARTRGNYPGTLSYDNAQVDPNNSSQYDLIELLDNRRGPLPHDRPHALKLDGFTTFELGERDRLTVGARFRMISGAPVNALGGHPFYGPNEVFLLPRGSLGRNEPDHNLSVRVAYAKDLGRGMTLELFADVFNLYDRQGTTGVDETYAPAFTDNTTRSISGGSYEDLIWLKASDGGGRETDDAGVPFGPAVGNLNFRNTAARAAPIATQLGMRLMF